ncbi:MULTISPECIES: heavy-metal-associated domain-containing protein [Clostridiaceae]|uniref:Heavy-metal-associated domain-containing protein n=1 Tax=Clostridium facile TaxID=2763035 RepID=A0ABR7INF3_9CLOT|nr:MULTISPECIES: heavy-metal-associated domain-containing protein [Clostridiaceae]MBC5786673.1 heavy-metal-associated domain-containing protein [Clostridium facile]PWN00016.1 MAG: copper chaperone [Massilioclostridium sp.]
MTKVYINGMACQHCVNRVKGALEELGLSNVRVSLENRVASFDGTATNAQLIEAIEDVGFEVTKIETE